MEIIETASRLIREEIQEQETLKNDKKRRLALAAESAISDYMPGGALHDLWLEEMEDRIDIEAAEAAIAEEGDNISLAELKAELGL